MELESSTLAQHVRVKKTNMSAPMRKVLILVLLLCSHAEKQCGGQTPQKPLLFGAGNALANHLVMLVTLLTVRYGFTV